jgi:hypothetical protein
MISDDFPWFAMVSYSIMIIMTISHDFPKLTEIREEMATRMISNNADVYPHDFRRAYDDHDSNNVFCISLSISKVPLVVTTKSVKIEQDKLNNFP